MVRYHYLFSGDQFYRYSSLKNEFECGNHYARAMASWSLLLALSGFRYSAPAGRISFAPVINADNFRSFFSTGSGWGSFAQSHDNSSFTATLELRFGAVEIGRPRQPAPAKAGASFSRE